MNTRRAELCWRRCQDIASLRAERIRLSLSSPHQKVTDQQYTVTGDLTFHGVTKPLTVQANIVGQGKGVKGESIIGAEVHFTLKRSEYGVNYGLPGVGDDVELTVAVGGAHK